MGTTTTVGARLRALRDAAGLSQRQLAKAIDSHGPAIALLETDKRPLGWQYAHRLAEALKTTPEYILEGRETVDAKLVAKPEPRVTDEDADRRIYLWERGLVQAGSGMIPAEEPPEGAHTPVVGFHYADWPGCFVLRVRGTSMQPFFPDGSRVVIRPVKPEPTVGSPGLADLLNTIVVAQRSDGETTLKALARAGRGWRLVPANTEEHDPIPFTKDWRVIGQMIAHKAPEPEQQP
jgi:SOS-response transcriptional repressor LexA